MTATTEVSSPFDCDARKLEITKWSSLQSTKGTRVAIGWSGLATLLSDPVLVSSGEPPGWSPALFDENRRKKDRVLEVTALGLDIDSGRLDLDSLREAFAGVKALVHNTRSSTRDANRWRVVIALSRPVSAPEHAAILAYERDRLALLNIALDEKTKDPSRLWFIPTIPAEGEFMFEAFDGAPLDVDSVLAEVFAQVPFAARAESRARPAGSEDDWLASISASTRKRRAHAWCEKAEVAIAGQRGHDATMRVATAVTRGFALDRTNALEVLSSWNARCLPPWSHAELAHKVDEAARVGRMNWGEKLRKEERGNIVALPTPADGRPIIRIDHELGRVVDAAVAAIKADASIFQRDGQLVHVVRVPENEANATALEGTPQIRGLAVASLREKLASAARWEKYDGRSEGFKRTTPTDDVASAVRDRGQWKGIRPLVGVIEAPSLRPDGTVIQKPGYDATTGFVLIPNEVFPEVPETPSHDDARRALAELREPLADFPYPTEAHRSATLAAILTLIARPAIRGSVPGFIFDASTRGSGKTLQADVVSIVATGRVSAKMGYPIDDEELEKVLGGYALRGALLVNFDNVTRPFGGAPLDKCLTAHDRVELRVLGKSELPALPWRAVILATGNNVALVGDTARRVLFSRLEPREEEPEHRTDFRIADLRAYVQGNRARLVAAGLTLLRAFVVAGRPNVGTKVWGSFESWSSLIPAALVWCGAADPMLARATGDGIIEPEKAALESALHEWPRLTVDGLTARAAISSLYPPNRREGPPDGFDALREAIETLTNAQHGRPPTANQLGKALSRVRRRVVGGRCFDQRSAKGGFARWFVSFVSSAQPSHSLPIEQGDVGDVGDVVSTQGFEDGNSITVHSGEPRGNSHSGHPPHPKADEVDDSLGAYLKERGLT